MSISRRAFALSLAGGPYVLRAPGVQEMHRASHVTTARNEEPTDWISAR